MSIKAYVDELTMINTEIKRNNANNKKLRDRLKELENNITSYLKTKEQAGLKYNGNAILIENKELRPVKKKKEIYDETISILERLGIDNPVEAYNKLQDVKRGEIIEKTKLKIKKIPVNSI
jgi:hypothetical protein